MQAVAIAFGANYEVLFCCLPGFKANGRRVKVDIMILLIACGLLGPLGGHLADQLYPGHAALCPLVMRMQRWRDHKASRHSISMTTLTSGGGFN